MYFIAIKKCFALKSFKKALCSWRLEHLFLNERWAEVNNDFVNMRSHSIWVLWPPLNWAALTKVRLLVNKLHDLLPTLGSLFISSFCMNDFAILPRPFLYCVYLEKFLTQHLYFKSMLDFHYHYNLTTTRDDSIVCNGITLTGSNAMQ